MQSFTYIWEWGKEAKAHSFVKKVKTTCTSTKHMRRWIFRFLKQICSLNQTVRSFLLWLLVPTLKCVFKFTYCLFFPTLVHSFSLSGTPNFCESLEQSICMVRLRPEEKFWFRFTGTKYVFLNCGSSMKGSRQKKPIMSLKFWF